MKIVIIHSKYGPRKKSHGPTYLLDKNNPIIFQQIAPLKDYNIDAVIGFDFDRFLKMKVKCNIINHANYESAGSLNELSLLEVDEDILVINGPIIVSKKTARFLSKEKHSTAIIEPVSSDDIGCTINKDFYIENLLWGLPYKLSGVFFLKKNDAKFLVEFSKIPENKNKFFFEGLNELLKYSKLKAKFNDNYAISY